MATEDLVLTTEGELSNVADAIREKTGTTQEMRLSDFAGAIDRMVSIAPYNNAGSHNAIYRGQFLGNTVTDAQYTAISSGTFEDLYIGDYWTIGGVNYRIAAFDYYLRCGDADCTKHHVTLVPDTCLYNAQYNNTESGGYEADKNTTVGGYVGSDMYKTNLEKAKTMIKSAFGTHVLNHRKYLINAVSNGRPTSGLWVDSEVELMNESMVYGAPIYSHTTSGTAIPCNFRVDKTQLPLFAHEPSRIDIRTYWWLRDTVSASFFAFVNSYGYAYSYHSSNSFGVRPAFSIS